MNFKNLREVLSPHNAVAQAYQMEWVDQEKLWLQMLHDRNFLSHHYEKESADVIYARVKTYYPEMEAVYEKLRKLSVDFY